VSEQTGYIGVSQNSGTPKWMVKMMENPIKMDDFGGTPIFGNTHMFLENTKTVGTHCAIRGTQMFFVMR